MNFLFFEDWICLKETKNDSNRCVLLNQSILNGPEEGAVRGREVVGEA